MYFNCKIHEIRVWQESGLSYAINYDQIHSIPVAYTTSNWICMILAAISKFDSQSPLFTYFNSKIHEIRVWQELGVSYLINYDQIKSIAAAYNTSNWIGVI